MSDALPSLSFPQRLKRWHILLAMLIVLLAIGVRLLVLFERALNQDPTYLNLQFGNDEETYWRYANAFFADGFPYRPYVNQPGITYVYIALMLLFGRSAVMLNLAMIVLDGLAVGALIGAGWLLTKRAWGGFVAGLLVALYPVSMFYSTTLLIAPLAYQLMAWIVFFILWHRERHAWWKLIALGAMLGYLVATRANLAPIAVLWVLLQAWERPSWRAWFLRVSVTAGVALLVVAPFTLWNLYIGDDFQFMTASGASQLYSGNNRDGTGFGGGSLAYRTVDVPYEEAIWRDVQVAPVRMAGLFVRKALLHWHPAEIGNNLDFTTTRELSSTLQSVPLSFSGLAFLAIVGLAFLWRDDRPLAFFLGVMLVYLMLAMAISFAISRLRYPVVALLVPLGAYGVMQIGYHLRHAHKPLLIPIALASMVIFTPMLLLDADESLLLPQRTYAELPADAVHVGAFFGEDDEGLVELVGWRGMWPWWTASTNGWAYLDEAHTVELFWRVVRPLDEKLAFYMAFVQDGVRIFGMDAQLGNVSYPPVTTDMWASDVIYGEIVSILPARQAGNVMLAQAGQINVGVFGEAPVEGVTDIFRDLKILPNEAPFFTLQMLAYYDADTPLPSVPPLPRVQQVFGVEGGDQIILTHADISQEDALALTLAWQAQGDIRLDYNFFVHVVDEAGELVAQYDAPPNAQLPTSTWLPDYPVTTQTFTIPRPEATGTYTLYLGLYELGNFTRLAVADTPDNRYVLGTITID
jgi:hypothetical protein